MIETISNLLGMDLSPCNPDLVFIVASIFLLFVVGAVYDLLMLVFGHICGRKR